MYRAIFLDLGHFCSDFRAALLASVQSIECWLFPPEQASNWWCKLWSESHLAIGIWLAESGVFDAGSWFCVILIPQNHCISRTSDDQSSKEPVFFELAFSNRVMPLNSGIWTSIVGFCKLPQVSSFTTSQNPEIYSQNVWKALILSLWQTFRVYFS